MYLNLGARLTGPLAPLGRSWERSLHAQNVADSTSKTYMTALRLFFEFANDLPEITGLSEVQRRHVEDFLSFLRDKGQAASTVSNRYRALQQFFKWAVDEEEIDVSPMAKIKAPIVPEQPIPLVSTDVLKTLISSCSGKAFVDRRDTTILRLFMDGGIRLGEIANLYTDSVNYQYDVVTVMGKGRKERNVPFGKKTAQALDRYDRVRARQKGCHHKELWLDHYGNKPFGYSGISQMLTRRSESIGVHINPHLLRHIMSHEFQMAGGSESDLMMIMGWTSSAMPRRYGRSGAAERAREAGRRLSLGDRI